MKQKMIFILALTAIFLLAGPSLAQEDYEIPWSTVSGGGTALSVGDAYTLRGTVNQGSDDGTATGGDFSLSTGFQGGLTSSGVPGASRGNCNRLIEGLIEGIDAGDLSALSNEIFDGDGTQALATLQGSFEGHPGGCDANADGVVDAGDVACLVLIIFEGPGSCGGEVTNNIGGTVLSQTLMITGSGEADTGDCNGDGLIDAGDVAALALEMNDSDGLFTMSASTGGFVSVAQGCDANSDGIIDSQDLDRLVTVIFG